MLMRTGRFDESIVQYKKALSVDPNFGGSCVGIASDLMFQGKHKAATAQAQKLHDAARDDGDRRTAMLSRAVIYVDRAGRRRALREMEKRLRSRRAHRRDRRDDADAGLLGDILLGPGGRTRQGKRYQQSSP